MAFANIGLTEEQRNEFAVRKIKNPYGSYYDVTDGIKPIYLALDNNSGNWLTWCYRYHDMDECVEEFLYMYRAVPIYVQAVYEFKEKNVTWRMTRMEAACEIPDTEGVRDTLTEAFQAYGAGGMPGDNSCFVNVLFN